MRHQACPEHVDVELLPTGGVLPGVRCQVPSQMPQLPKLPWSGPSRARQAVCPCGGGNQDSFACQLPLFGRLLLKLKGSTNPPGG